MATTARGHRYSEDYRFHFVFARPQVRPQAKGVLAEVGIEAFLAQ